MKEPRIILESFSEERDRASYSFSGIVKIIAAHIRERWGYLAVQKQTPCPKTASADTSFMLSFDYQDKEPMKGTRHATECKELLYSITGARFPF